jgi:hypothetical protein
MCCIANELPQTWQLPVNLLPVSAMGRVALASLPVQFPARHLPFKRVLCGARHSGSDCFVRDRTDWDRRERIKRQCHSEMGAGGPRDVD